MKRSIVLVDAKIIIIANMKKVTPLLLLTVGFHWSLTTHPNIRIKCKEWFSVFDIEDIELMPNGPLMAKVLVYLKHFSSAMP